MERLMTIKELAEYLQLEEHTIYKMVRKGEIPAYKIAGQWRFKREMIEEWLDQKLVSNGEKDMKKNVK